MHPSATVWLLVVLTLAVVALGALHGAYRRVLVRALRERHAEWWERLGRPRASYVGSPRGAWRLRRFLCEGRHYTLNDADLAAAGRLVQVTGRVLAALVAAGTWLALEAAAVL